MKRETQSKTGSALDRRNFFRALGGASVTAVAVASPMAATEAEAYDPGGDERRARYQEGAADVKAFYRTNGYETLKK